MSDTVDSQYRWVTCYRKQDAAAHVAYVDARVGVAENVKYVDYGETDDDCVETDDDCVKIGDEYVVDDAEFDYEVIVNAANEKETDDA